MDIELTISRGRGYIPAEENKVKDAPFGYIAIDSIHTPIKNVKYGIENYRVEQRTDYEKLILEVATDGTIHPEDAVKQASRILIQHLMIITDENITFDNKEDKKFLSFGDYVKNYTDDNESEETTDDEAETTDEE